MGSPIWEEEYLPLASVFYDWQREPKWKEGILIDRNAMEQTDQQWDEIDLSKTKDTCSTWRPNITGKGEIIIHLCPNHTRIPNLFHLLQSFPYRKCDSVSFFPNLTNPEEMVGGTSANPSHI